MPETSDLMVERRRRFLAYFAGAGVSSALLPGVLWAQMEEKKEQKVTVDMVKQAEHLIGLDFNDEERDLLIDGVNAHLDRYTKLRTYKLSNPTEPPALRFDPVLPGMKFDMTKRPLRPTKSPDLKRPSNLEDVAFWPAVHLAHLVRTKQVKSVELTEMYLDRLKRHNEKLNFYVSLTPELAMEQAKQADAEIAAGKYRGPLHGIPWGAKDLIAKKGYKTTWGAEPYKDQSFDFDATIVTRMESAGAVLIAKLATGELASGDQWFGGQTKNPWNTEEGSSGSSAGPASATGAGCVGFSIGTETGGSIVGPSTRCSVYGMRPSFGRSSRWGIMTLAWSLDKAGPICRSVEDCAVVMHAMQGRDDKDLAVTDVPFNWDPASIDIKKLRVGYVKAAFDAPRQSQQEKDNDTAALEKLRSMGVTLVPIEFPDFPVADLQQIMYTEFAAAHDELSRTHHGEYLQKKGRNSDSNLYRTNRFVPAVEYLQATRVRMLMMQDWAKRLADVDLYLTPITSFRAPAGGTAPRPTSSSTVVNINTTLCNLTGQPTIVVRNGIGPTGQPTSIAFSGKVYGETPMLALAHAYQMATDWHKRTPKL